MSFGGHSPKPGRHAPPGRNPPKGNPDPKDTSESDSGDSTPKAEGGNPRVSLADYERLKEVVKRFSDEKSAAFVEIDALVHDKKRTKEERRKSYWNVKPVSVFSIWKETSQPRSPFYWDGQR